MLVDTTPQRSTGRNPLGDGSFTWLEAKYFNRFIGIGNSSTLFQKQCNHWVGVGEHLDETFSFLPEKIEVSFVVFPSSHSGM